MDLPNAHPLLVAVPLVLLWPDCPAGPRRPNPVVQPWAPGVLNAIAVAATAPVVSAVPVTEAHSPTWMALESVGPDWLYTVSAVTVTVTCAGVEPAALEVSAAPPFGRATGVITMDPDPAEVTVPIATRPPKPPARP